LLRIKKPVAGIAAILSVLLLTYFVLSLYHSEPWRNILPPLNAFTAAVMIFFIYLKSDKPTRLAKTLLLTALVCAVWSIADIFWVVISLSGEFSGTAPIDRIAYIAVNCFLLSLMILVVIEQLQNWDFFQYCLDIFISGYSIAVIFWLAFLRGDISLLSAAAVSDFTLIPAVISDILMCIIILSLFLSVREGKLPVYMYFIMSGLVIYALNDMTHCYMKYYDLYRSYEVHDLINMLALLVAGLGVLHMLHAGQPPFRLFATKNVGGNQRSFYLLIFPPVLLLASASGFFALDIGFVVCLMIMFPLAFYLGACRFIRILTEKEAVLRLQNMALEQRVADQMGELTFLTNQDTLTMLYNRRYFMQCLDETLKSRGKYRNVAIMLIDIDRFKAINDSYGHDIGDIVLIEFSKRLADWNLYGAVIARLDGDEFTVMLSGELSQKRIEDYCQQIMALCTLPVIVGDNAFHLTVSVGVAVSTDDICDRKTLMKNADIAMYSAKSQGYNKYRFYDPLINQSFIRSIEIENQLRQADFERDFSLFFQPQYALPDIKLVGAEALLRWENQEHGYIPPNVFIPIAEELDLIFKIGKWAFRETALQAKTWNSSYNIPLKIGFNISPKQFDDKGFIKYVSSLIATNAINPEWIDAEITESAMIKDNKESREIIGQLKNLGITVSIDDFGSGYSCLSYLTKYPFDRLKLDKSLVDNITPHNGGGINIIRAAINMAHAAGIKTIAEGVETQEQLNILRSLGCDQVQGYLIGRPVPAEVFEQIYIKKRCIEAKARVV